MLNPWRKIYDSPECIDPWNNPPKFALFLDVEPTNHCNFDCIFCEGKQATRPKGYMDMALFEEICYQAVTYGARGIRFLRWGEPLLHENIIDMVKMATDYGYGFGGLLSHVTTNGSLLHCSMAAELIDAGLDSIIVSMQGTTANEYQEIRGINYDIVSSGIDNIKMLRKKNPHISISTTLTDETDEDVRQFREKWKGKVDYIGIGYTRLKRLKQKPDYLKDRVKDLPTRFKCQEIMTKLSIDWDGAVSPCCLDYDQQLTIGNINDNTLKELWESEQNKAIKTLLNNKREDLFVLCSTCQLNYKFRGQE